MTAVIQKCAWSPQPGPQALAAISPADGTMFGGSRGGGKSDCLLGRHMHGLQQYGRDWNGLIARRKYKDFGELRRRIDRLKSDGFPWERIGGDQQVNILRHGSGGQVTLAAFQRLEQADDYIGHQFCELSIDEGPMIPFFSGLVDKLKGSLRSPAGVPCRMFVTGNPGGPGHMAVKEHFRLGTGGNPPRSPFLISLDGPNGTKYVESRVFIPSYLEDNKILCENDPKYVAKLLSISDPALKRAWIEGDWDVFLGQAFQITDRHKIDPIPIPAEAPLFMTYDWGFGKPFSLGWWWADPDGRVYRFAEWYGCGDKPDTGLRLADSDVADGILEREEAMGLTGRMVLRVCDPTCFNKKADTMKGGHSPSTAEIFAAKGLALRPGNPDRVQKIRAFRERLKVPEATSELPMMVVYKTCKSFLRTVPALCMDDDNPEDIDTESEDHVYDESCHIAMTRVKGFGGTMGAIDLEACAA